MKIKSLTILLAIVIVVLFFIGCAEVSDEYEIVKAIVLVILTFISIPFAFVLASKLYRSSLSGGDDNA